MAWFEDGESKIYYTEEGGGEPLLMMPGWSYSIDDMSQLAARLTPRYRVIAADLPGSGKSGPQPRAYPPTFYHDDAKSFLLLLDRLGAAPAHLVGFSDGGEVALVMAEMRPASVRSVAVWGAAGTVDVPSEVLDAFENVVDAPAQGWSEFSDYLKGAYGEVNGRAMAKNFVSAIRAISAAGGDVSRARAAEIACPALLIAGEHDAMAAPAIVSALAKSIPRGEFVEAKGAPHSIHHSDPEWLFETIADWLAKH